MNFMLRRLIVVLAVPLAAVWLMIIPVTLLLGAIFYVATGRSVDAFVFWPIEVVVQLIEWAKAS